MSHFETNQMLTNAQHGFRSKQACETQLIEFLHEFSLRASFHEIVP